MTHGDRSGLAAAAGAWRHDVEDGVARLTLSRPPLNVLTEEALSGLRAELAALAGEREVRAVVLRAEGPHFSAGADVREHLAPAFRRMIPEFTRTIVELARFPAPVIAAVRGRCLGGGFELVQAADLVVAAEGATFGQPEIALGVFPPAACALLPARCGTARAAELILTGDAVTAARALELGLVTRVVPDARVDDEAVGLARRIARHSGAAVRLAKRALLASADAWTAAMAEAEALYVDRLMATADATEGLTAFLEKRPPAWTHR